MVCFLVFHQLMRKHLALLTNMVSMFKFFSEAPCLARKCGTHGVIVLLGLCNPPRRGRGEPAKPGLPYPLAWIPCCDTVSVVLGSQSRVGSIAHDLESSVMCYDRQD
jgi:hypothetical protein